MIKFENTEVMNFEGAIRGMRNPLNSWDKSDTRFNMYGYPMCDEIGPNDMNLMKRLIKAGTDHRKFLRQILVTVDITAPLYWWKEFDTYKIGTVANSCSTMHKIHDKEFEMCDFSTEHITSASGTNIMLNIIDELNEHRKMFNTNKEPEIKKDHWWNMIQLLPSSYNQKRTIMLNYEVLRNIATSRKNHKLDEWSIGFMNWIEYLPYAEDLILDGGEE